jgi:hypothetical protein
MIITRCSKFIKINLAFLCFVIVVRNAVTVMHAGLQCVSREFKSYRTTQ